MYIQHCCTAVFGHATPCMITSAWDRRSFGSAGRSRRDSEPHLHHRQPDRDAGCTKPGFDAGKLIKGKKRHLVDTQGLLLHGIVTAADRIATAA